LPLCSLPFPQSDQFLFFFFLLFGFFFPDLTFCSSGASRPTPLVWLFFFPPNFNRPCVFFFEPDAFFFSISQTLSSPFFHRPYFAAFSLLTTVLFSPWSLPHFPPSPPRTRRAQSRTIVTFSFQFFPRSLGPFKDCRAHRVVENRKKVLVFRSIFSLPKSLPCPLPAPFFPPVKSFSPGSSSLYWTLRPRSFYHNCQNVSVDVPHLLQPGSPWSVLC